MIWEPTNTQKIAGGVYNMDEDVNGITLAEGKDIGSYNIKITPDINNETVTLQFVVKIYYCLARNIPRPRFFETFPRDAYIRHSDKLVTWNRTVEELDQELIKQSHDLIQRGSEIALF
jgi:hypothetical protein